jgi:hypothetical protein
MFTFPFFGLGFYKMKQALVSHVMHVLHPSGLSCQPNSHFGCCCKIFFAFAQEFEMMIDRQNCTSVQGNHALDASIIRLDEKRHTPQKCEAQVAHSLHAFHLKEASPSE